MPNPQFLIPNFLFRTKKLFFAFLFFGGLCCASCLPDRRVKKEAPPESINYAELGFPNLDSVWGIDAYEKAAMILSGVHKKNFKSLPRKHDKESGRIFNRLVAIENVRKILNDHDGETLTRFSKSMAELNLAYVDTYREQQYYHEELAEIEVFSLKFQDEVFTVLSNMNLDLSIPEAKAGFDDMRKGYVVQIVRTLHIQMEKVGYTEADMLLVSDAISESLSANLLLLDTDSIKAIAEKMRLVINASKSRKVKDAYSKILKSLQ